ncbi:2,3-bisphosphoglycerate-independent phosphoglycerate mutase [Candidatus Micrarchaeota archaeon]|nr:2,3-bisphosphoglycerate-independent phosphoglycerate mutase [Candidatus Micrarchaeota archaeon]
MGCLLIIFDGLGDRPVPFFSNKTPLEAAHTPNLDFLASKGVCGLMDSIGVGVRPASDTAHLSIFGFDPKKYYFGRGVLECIGLGMDVRNGDACFRVNFGTINSKKIIIDRRAGRIDETGKLVDSLNKIKLSTGIKVIVGKGVQHRAGVLFRGKGILARVSDADPHEENKPMLSCKPLDGFVEARLLADSVNEFVSKANAVLANHPLNKKRRAQKLLPANCILLRGAGSLGEIPSFRQKWGLSASCVAGGKLYKGVAKLVGMKVIDVPTATGKAETDFKAKVDAAVKALKSSDFVFLHFKGTDLMGEDGNAVGKKDYLEKADRHLGVLHQLSKEHLIVVTGDHSTPCELKAHSGDPVPIVFSGRGCRRDHVTHFNERDCSTGALCRITGLQVMNEVLNVLGRAPLYGD